MVYVKREGLCGTAPLSHLPGLAAAIEVVEDLVHLVVFAGCLLQGYGEAFFVVVDAELFELTGIAAAGCLGELFLLLEDANMMRSARFRGP